MNLTLVVFLFRCWQPVCTRALGFVAILILSLCTWPIRVSYLVGFWVALLFLSAFVNRRAFRNWRPNLWIWRLSRRVVGFRAMKGNRVSLLFQAGLDEAIDLQEIIRLSESNLDDYSQRFGTRLRRRLTVVLISSHQEITVDFGRPMGGTALISADAVVLAADCPLQEGLRHELSHLFAFRWNLWAPPLLQEGLAVWLQKITPEQTHPAADTGFLLSCDADPSHLLDSGYFIAPDRMHVSYALAGGFTGFLIRRFGWDRFRLFYSKANDLNFRDVFNENFGMSYEEAWRCCHDESVALACLNRMREADRLFNPLV